MAASSARAGGPLSLPGARLRGPLTLAVLCLVPVVIWATALPLGPRFSTLGTALTSLATALALAGVASFALNLALGARFGLVDDFFGGLDSMYGVHQVNGRVAYGLLLGHAGLIVAGRATTSIQSALDLFTPAAGWTIAFGLIALIGMTVSIALTLYARVNHEMFVYIQRSFGFIFLIGIFHVFTTAGIKSFSRPLTLYLATLSALGLAAFAYRSLFDDVLVRRHNYLVTRSLPLDPSVMEITMSPVGRRLVYKPGQFAFVTFSSRGMDDRLHPISLESEGPSEIVTLRAGAIHKQFHPFSITSDPRERELRVVVKAVGDYTSAMRALESGASARVEGPYGKFSYTAISNPRQIWIAGGIGITPFLSMARSLGAPGLDVDLFYATKRRSQTYFLDELRAIARDYESLRVHDVIEDETGFLTAEMIELGAGSLEGKDVLICGPPPMIESLRKQLRAAQVPNERIHYELFGFLQREMKRKARPSR